MCDRRSAPNCGTVGSVDMSTSLSTGSPGGEIGHPVRVRQQMGAPYGGVRCRGQYRTIQEPDVRHATSDVPAGARRRWRDMSSLSCAYWLSRQPERYDVTIHQQGWRLGGKLASGRNLDRHGRIEEHGLHVWSGFYENAFWMIREVYGELDRPPTHPLATWQGVQPVERCLVVQFDRSALGPRHRQRAGQRPTSRRSWTVGFAGRPDGPDGELRPGAARLRTLGRGLGAFDGRHLGRDTAGGHRTLGAATDVRARQRGDPLAVRRIPRDRPSARLGAVALCAELRPRHPPSNDSRIGGSMT